MNNNAVGLGYVLYLAGEFDTARRIGLHQLTFDELCDYSAKLFDMSNHVSYCTHY